jgi:hypothetical protein
MRDWNAVQRPAVVATRQFAIQLFGALAGALFSDRYECIQPWIELGDLVETPVGQLQAGDLA